MEDGRLPLPDVSWGPALRMNDAMSKEYGIPDRIRQNLAYWPCVASWKVYSFSLWNAVPVSFFIHAY